jgi:lysophospholipase L1-like esterase
MPRVFQWAKAHATLAGVVLIVLSVLCAGTLAEALTRLVLTVRGHYPQKDPILHHSLKPHAQMKRVESEFQVVYRINRHGLRDEEIRLPKPPQVFRILMVGDSFTFGVGVELHATFTKQLEALLNQPGSGGHYEVLNGGCSSYSPILEYLFLVQKGLALAPDLVILNYDLSDVQDDYQYSQIAEFDRDGRPLRVHPLNVQWYYREERKRFRSALPLLERSALYQGLREAYVLWQNRRDAAVMYEAAQAIAGNIAFDRDLPLREHVDWQPYFEHSTRYISMIAELLQGQGIGFLVTTYPYGVLVSAQEWRVGRQLRGFDNRVYTTRLFDYMAAFCQANNIPYLNTLPDFLRADTFPLFYPYDGHFTPNGHRVMAQALARFLREKHLLDKSLHG